MCADCWNQHSVVDCVLCLSGFEMKKWDFRDELRKKFIGITPDTLDVLYRGGNVIPSDSVKGKVFESFCKKRNIERRSLARVRFSEKDKFTR